MKILLNASTIKAGGGLQVGNSLISEFSKMGSLDLNVCCSNEVYWCLNESIKNKIKTFTFDKSPAKLKYRSNNIERLFNIENKISPDIVLTVFGPSYWKPTSPHLLGFALPQIAYPENPFFSSLSLKKRFRYLMEFKYKKYQFKSNSSYFWCETEDVKNKISQNLNIPFDHIFVAGNTCSLFFKNPDINKIRFPRREAQEFRLVFPTSYNLHKNLEVIPKVLPLLSNYNVKFFVTLAPNDFERIFFNCENRIINLGILRPDECPSVYYHCDALFCPTLLECFTANYPEAMSMKRPILTSHYSFAKAICKDAAIYFDPLDPRDIADKIIKIIKDNVHYKKMQKLGTKQLNIFPNALQRANLLLDSCRTIIEKEAIHVRR